MKSNNLNLKESIQKIFLFIGKVYNNFYNYAM